MNKPVKLVRLEVGDRIDELRITVCVNCESRAFHVISYNNGPHKLECTNCRTLVIDSEVTMPGAT